MRQLALALLILHLAACSSMQTVHIPDVQAGGDNSPVFPGDRVEVVTHDNERLEFPVTDITKDGISGQFGFIRYDDMRSISVRKPGSDGEATKWILGALAAAAVIVLVASADSVNVCSGTPCPGNPD